MNKITVCALLWSVQSLLNGCATQEAAVQSASAPKSVGSRPSESKPALQLEGAWALIPQEGSTPETLFFVKGGEFAAKLETRIIYGTWSLKETALQRAFEFDGDELLYETKVSFINGNLRLTDENGEFVTYQKTTADVPGIRTDSWQQITENGLSFKVPVGWKTRIEPLSASGHQRAFMVNSSGTKTVFFTRIGPDNLVKITGREQNFLMDMGTKIIDSMHIKMKSSFEPTKIPFYIKAMAVLSAEAENGEAQLAWVPEHHGFTGVVMTLQKHDALGELPLILQSLSVESH